MRRALTGAAVVAAVAGCRAPGNDLVESTAECRDAAAVCQDIAAGDWQMELAADPSTHPGVMWREPCVGSMAEAQADPLVASMNQEWWWEWRPGFWFDAGVPGELATFRVPDCALVIDTDFPGGVEPQLAAAQVGADAPLHWRLTTGTRASAAGELVAAVEASWAWANAGVTSDNRHYLYDASAGVEDGVYAWQYCRVHDALVDGVHLTCHRYTFDPDTSRLEMHLTWGEELPCDPGEPLAPLG